MSSFALFVLVYLIFFHSRRRRRKYWNGPAPTAAQRKKNLQWIEGFLYKYPDSGLRNDYPEIASKNLASKRYDVITRLHRSGQMSDAEYEIELEKILPLIDVTEDLPK